MTPFCFPFFFTMKRRRFIQNAPFHLNVAPAYFPNSVLNLSFVLLSPHNVIWILRINSIASLPISVSTPIVGRAFHFSPWPLFMQLDPQLINKLSISSIWPLILLITSPIFTRLFQFGPWFWISSIKSLIGH